MASNFGHMTVVNLGNFLQGIADAQKLQLRYMRTELKRGAQRIRKSFINKQLKGPPGIKATKLARGKNVWTFAGGSSLASLHAKIGINRILHVHEKGMTIRPTSGTYLYLSAKSGARKGRILAVVPKVVIPARLRFRQQVHAEAPAMLVKVAQAGMRATEVAMSKQLKKSIGNL